jgi:hypothetical protein
MGEVDWNPDLQVLRHRITAWNLVTKKLRGCRVGSKYLLRVIKKTDLVSGSFDLSLSDAILAQRANFKEYKLARNTHEASRASWLQQLARSKSQDDGKSEDQHMELLISIEKQRQQAHILMLNA